MEKDILMRIKLFIILFLAAAPAALSQDSEKIRSFETGRLDLNNNGLLILGAWAAGNILIGTVGNFSAAGEKKYFHQFNAMWNVVNLGIAAGGYYANSLVDVNSLSYSEIFNEYSWLQSFYLLNAGLDAAYITAGFYLLEKSKNSPGNSDRLKGYGYSLFVQGGFLLIFDVLMYSFNLQHAKNNLYPYLAVMQNDSHVIGLKVIF